MPTKKQESGSLLFPKEEPESAADYRPTEEEVTGVPTAPEPHETETDPPRTQKRPLGSPVEELDALEAELTNTRISHKAPTEISDFTDA